MITIDGKFTKKTVTGVQRYAIEIVAALDKLWEETAAERPRATLLCPTKKPLELKTIEVQTASFLGPLLWTQFTLAARRAGPLVCLENVAPTIHPAKVVCVHDLNPLVRPESYSFAFRTYYRFAIPGGIRGARAVVSVSSYSADLISKFGFCPRHAIEIVPPGCEHMERWNARRSRFAEKDVFKRPFVLLVGSAARHKNLQCIAQIAHEIGAMGLDIVVAGSKEGPFKGITISPHVRHLGYVSDDDLAALFQSAFCFVFPSLIEGFGLPALEAMFFGCPVIASNSGSLPEVCGEAALFADPQIPRTWLQQIERLRQSPTLRSALVSAGRSRARQFSWTEAARRYDRILRRIERTP